MKGGFFRGRVFLMAALLVAALFVFGGCGGGGGDSDDPIVESDYEFAFSLKCGENEDGRFSYIDDITVDAQNNVYVVGADGVQKFSPDGQFLARFLAGGDGIAIDNVNSVVYFLDLILSENENARVIVRNLNTFEPLREWTTTIGGGGGSYFSKGFAVDSVRDAIYIADIVNNKVWKYDTYGNFIASWGEPGKGDGQFALTSTGLAVDNGGNVYVVDNDNTRVQKFDHSGKYITQWQSNQLAPLTGGIDIDSSGNVYITEACAVSSRRRVEKFSSSGKSLAILGTYGDEDGKLIFPYSVTVDSEGSVYVVDWMDYLRDSEDGYRVQKFTPKKK